MKDSLPPPDITLSSTQNRKIRHSVRLRDRRYRDSVKETLIEGFRELRQAVRHGHMPTWMIYCPELFLGDNEGEILTGAKAGGALLIQTTTAVFETISYRDRPDGLIGVAPAIYRPLSGLTLATDTPLLLIAQAIEKPGNLGTMLRTADGCGMDAVIVCDRKTDINNPNVIRASVGAVFAIPPIEAGSAETIAFLGERRVQIVATTPGADKNYWDVDLRRATAIVVGSEQYGLSESWLAAADERVAIPMAGTADSLNVSAAMTILSYEAVRQRSVGAS